MENIKGNEQQYKTFEQEQMGNLEGNEENIQIQQVSKKRVNHMSLSIAVSVIKMSKEICSSITVEQNLINKKVLQLLILEWY